MFILCIMLFFNFLSMDLGLLLILKTGIVSKKSSYQAFELVVLLKGEEMLTWNNIEKLGGRTSVWGNLDTLTYRVINDEMHICAGDKKTDSCQVII